MISSSESPASCASSQSTARLIIALAGYGGCDPRKNEKCRLLRVLKMSWSNHAFEVLCDGTTRAMLQCSLLFNAIDVCCRLQAITSIIINCSNLETQSMNVDEQCPAESSPTSLHGRTMFFGVSTCQIHHWCFSSHQSETLSDSRTGEA